MRTRIPQMVLATALLLGGAARAEDVVEPSTGHAFPATRSVDGKSYTLTGAGVRKKFIIKVYAMGLYVEDGDGKKAFAGAHPSADNAPSFLAHGGFGKLAVLHFVRDVGAEKVRDAYNESLEDELSDKAPADVRDGAKAFIALFDHDMKSGEEVHIRTSSDGKIDVTIAGAKKGGLQNAKLVPAIWKIWLGGHPISTDLKKALVERIDALGR